MYFNVLPMWLGGTKMRCRAVSALNGSIPREEAVISRDGMEGAVGCTFAQVPTGEFGGGMLG